MVAYKNTVIIIINIHALWQTYRWLREERLGKGNENRTKLEERENLAPSPLSLTRIVLSGSESLS